MPEQKALEESIEKMGVWVSWHPSGTMQVQQGLERMTIFPHERRWTYRIHQVGQVNPYKSGFYTRKDVQLFTHMILKWAWKNGAKTNAV